MIGLEFDTFSKNWDPKAGGSIHVGAMLIDTNISPLFFLSSLSCCLSWISNFV